MTQLTQVKLEQLSVLKLYEHYGALERSLPLLTAESQEVAKAELEACAHLRSEKVDRIYYAMAAHEDALERIKKESDLITQSKRHHESQLQSSLKGLLNYSTSGPSPGFEQDHRSQLSVYPCPQKKELTVEDHHGPRVLAHSRASRLLH
jgi:hypothetical protein